MEQISEKRPSMINCVPDCLYIGTFLNKSKKLNGISWNFFFSIPHKIKIGEQIKPIKTKNKTPTALLKITRAIPINGDRIKKNLKIFKIMFI